MISLLMAFRLRAKLGSVQTHTILRHTHTHTVSNKWGAVYLAGQHGAYLD